MRVDEETVSSRSNPFIVRASSLMTAKGRRETGYVIFDGKKLLAEFCISGGTAARVLVSEEALGQALDFIGDMEKKTGAELRVTPVRANVFEKLTDEKGSEGIVTVAKRPDSVSALESEKDAKSLPEPAVMLCSVRDPGNVGACVRSAAAFGYRAVIITPDCADIFSPKVLRASMGTVFHMRFFEAGAEDAVRLLSAYRRVICAELREGAAAVDRAGILPGDIFVIGNEGSGIPGNVSRISSGSVYIPIDARAESLNAAVAASLLMWEQSRAARG